MSEGGNSSIHSPVSLSLLRPARLWPGKARPPGSPSPGTKNSFLLDAGKGEGRPPKNELLGFVFSSFKKICKDAKGEKFSWCPQGTMGMSGRGSQRRAGEAGSGREKGRLAEGKGLALESGRYEREVDTGDGTLAAQCSDTHGSGRGQQEVGALGKLGRKKWQ